MSPRTASHLAWGLAGLAIVLAAAQEVLSLSNAALDFGEISTDIVFVALLLVFATVGALIASRHPRNSIGWIFCAVAVMAGVGGLSDGYAEHWLNGKPASQTLGETAAWYQNVAFVAFTMAPAMFLPLLFPDGRLLSRRWRLVAWCGGLGMAAFVAVELLSPGPLEEFPQLQNPYAIEGPLLDVLDPLASLLLPIGLLGAPLSLVLRFRRSGYEQRQQIKWLTWAAAVAATTVLVTVLPIGDLVDPEVTSSVVGLSVLGLPLAAGVAILRYRLYEIDVVINRTLVYGALSATLAGTYLVSVLLLQLILSTVTAENGLAVAGSTLAVAALFQPARRRIQASVDRRFYRSRYDAQRTLERFGARLRDEVDITALGSELRGVVAETMQPAHVSLWLRTPGERR